jgi:hypothetical protein
VCIRKTEESKSNYDDYDNDYSKGIEIYVEHYKHCSNRDLIIEAMPNALAKAQLVHDFYNQVSSNLISNLKLIVVLHETSSNETIEQLKTWMMLFDRKQLLVLSHSELQNQPERIQWRIEQFFDKKFQLAFESHVNVKLEPQVEPMHPVESYRLVETEDGPWMEERPYPRVTRKFAYAALLGWNPDPFQNKIYLDATRILMGSMKASEEADFVVLMTYHDNEAESILRREGAIIKHVAPIEHSLDITYFEPWFVDIAYSKLRAFELTEYARVQVVDVDSAISGVEKMDKLFTLFPDAKIVAEGRGSESPIRAGWLMIWPSLHDFDAMKQLLERGVFTSERGWDNLDLPVDYPGWKAPKSMNNWEFYGSQLEQGKRKILHH